MKDIGLGVVGEWKWENTPCRTFRLCHKQLHVGIFVKEWEGLQDKQQKKECVMEVQDEYVDGGSLEVNMQN